MANTSSAKKAIRSSAKKAVNNIRAKKTYKDARKAVLKAVVSKDKKAADSLLPVAYKAIDKAAKTKVIAKNAASRYKSRLATKVNSI